jgi:hypothetical protein
MRPALALTIAMLVLLVGVPGGAKDAKPATDLASYKPVAAAAKAAKALTLYEGLPHPLWENELLAAERKNKKTVKLHDYPFYAETLKFKDKDAKAVKALLRQSKRFRGWKGEKDCGGFHPDYLIEWKQGKDVYRVLFCFGCEEIKAFGPKGAVRLDMTAETKKELARILKPYRKNRPAPKKE